MPRPDAAATRQRLLDAGSELTRSQSLATLTVDAIVAQAGCAKGTFFTHFPSRAEYFVALHRAFHERIAKKLHGALKDQPPGLPTLLHTANVYLDACRREHSVKALLIEARTLPEIMSEIGHQDGRFEILAAAEFEVAGWSSPRYAARLWVALVAAAALAEAEANRKLPQLRLQLPRFLSLEPPQSR
jgi:AcrR family transcriptional regulator